MCIFHDREIFPLAEAVQHGHIAAGKQERGAKDQNVQRCIIAYASIYKVQTRLAESFELYEKVLQNQVNVLG